VKLSLTADQVLVLYEILREKCSFPGKIDDDVVRLYDNVRSTIINSLGGERPRLSPDIALWLKREQDKIDKLSLMKQTVQTDPVQTSFLSDNDDEIIRDLHYPKKVRSYRRKR
jgi:hypothetical protein